METESLKRKPSSHIKSDISNDDNSATNSGLEAFKNVMTANIDQDTCTSGKNNKGVIFYFMARTQFDYSYFI